MQELGTSTAAAVVLVLGAGGAALGLPEGIDRATADLYNFNIGAGVRVQIVQSTTNSALLGRVTSGSITQIHGRLDANGRVLLVNPAGVLVAPERRSCSIRAMGSRLMGWLSRSL